MLGPYCLVSMLYISLFCRDSSLCNCSGSCSKGIYLVDQQLVAITKLRGKLLHRMGKQYAAQDVSYSAALHLKAHDIRHLLVYKLTMSAGIQRGESLYLRLEEAM